MVRSATGWDRSRCRASGARGGDGVWNRAAFGFRESLGTGLSGTPKL